MPTAPIKMRERIEARRLWYGRASARQKPKYESDAKQHAIVPGETDGAIECARTKIDRDRADYTDRVQAGQRGEVCCKKQHHNWQTDRDEQRPHAGRHDD